MHGEDAAVREDSVIDEEDGGVLGQLAGEAAAGRVEVQARSHALLHALQRIAAQARDQRALPEPARRHIPVPHVVSQESNDKRVDIPGLGVCTLTQATHVPSLKLAQ